MGVSYAEVLPKVEALEPGCELLDALQEMGGIYMTLNHGEDYFLALAGHLRPWMKEGDYPLVSVGDGGRYRFWPLGYLENEKPRVQVTLVFRNEALLTVLEDATRESAEAFVAEH